MVESRVIFVDVHHSQKITFICLARFMAPHSRTTYYYYRCIYVLSLRCAYLSWHGSADVIHVFHPSRFSSATAAARNTPTNNPSGDDQLMGATQQQHCTMGVPIHAALHDANPSSEQPYFTLGRGGGRRTIRLLSNSSIDSTKTEPSSQGTCGSAPQLAVARRPRSEKTSRSNSHPAD